MPSHKLAILGLCLLVAILTFLFTVFATRPLRITEKHKKILRLYDVFHRELIDSAEQPSGFDTAFLLMMEKLRQCDFPDTEIDFVAKIPDVADTSNPNVERVPVKVLIDSGITVLLQSKYGFPIADVDVKFYAGKLVCRVWDWTDEGNDPTRLIVLSDNPNRMIQMTAEEMTEWQTKAREDKHR